MAANYKEPGNVLDWTNGSGSAVSVGAAVVVGTLVGIVIAGPVPGSSTIANGASGVVRICGVFNYAKNPTDVVAQGVNLYLDVAANRLTTTASGNTLAGKAAYAAGSGVTTVDLMLNGLPTDA